MRTEYDLKRQAMQLVVQLPEDPAEAKRVLDLAKQVVEVFYERDQPRPAVPSLVAISNVRPLVEPK